MKYLRYLWYVIRHKWYVFLELRKEGLWWLGITHDWSKLRPSEFFPYAEHFYGKGKKGIKEGRNKSGYYKAGMSADEAFDFAWLLHQKRNKHHWQWWVLPLDDGGMKALEMQGKYFKEMLCDWHGASKAQGHGDKIVQWWDDNNRKMNLNESTRRLAQYHVDMERLDEMKGKILNIANRYDTPEEEAAYQRGYSEGYEACHHNLMLLMYVILSKRKDKSIVIMDEELRGIPENPKILIESIANKGGRRWSIDEGQD